ncbi:hydrophobic/amphiphilic exporter-1, HAE1 family [Desulfuromusa kysingii]|uniref:Hydrophobic/amphiphilic exporter-1, HAE1 family n=1 Tax=Desulfuromusa kysingii TaxID=37625 RepID=A0A1H3YB43_9BACT|nr:efflux RND transporter permease subunit [Desulfuromusa kysingii]SEA08733.1 hydrophobic/amphiphilic exporter-1, HAE1 family [Desulfuromusa kysingii]
MPRFFIERPIFAWVIAIVIMLGGVFAIETLPVEQYPEIAPPSVTINASYPGASAEVLENSVTQIIEQSLTGIDYLRYFSSSSDSNGSLSITLTFEPEADPDIAQVQVQNKVSGVTSLLPQTVQQLGVNVKKSSSSFLMVIGIYSTDPDVSEHEISDYLKSKMAEPISRVTGVGDVMVFGQQHSMRIWLNPEQLNSYNLMPADIEAAVQSQNVEVTAGQLGGAPAVTGQQLNASIRAMSKLETVEDFEGILIRVNEDGSQVRLRDVARVELGSQSYDRIARYKGSPASGMGIYLGTGANALDTAEMVKAKAQELKAFMPESYRIVFPYDTTPFVELSIHEVFKTLIEAVVLVFLVMFLFLQNLRATLIPTIAVPVVLLGTFGILSAFGYSINVLTMFAMVLAIGLLVDDAIVVVENVERVMSEEGLAPKEATKKSMQQITGALVGIAMVLSAVFVPMAFFSGSTGAIYRQFSITIVSAMALSVLVALVLTPALCATMLKPVEQGHGLKRKGFFGWFNRTFERGKGTYRKSVGFVAARSIKFFIVYLIILGGLVVMFNQLPTAFLPDEDQGIMLLMIQAPPGSTLERTRESAKKVEEYFLTQEEENVDSIFTATGFSFAGQGQNVGIGFVRLKDWDVRLRPDQKSAAIAQRALRNLYSIKDASVYTFIPPPIPALGNASGFDFKLIDQAGLGHEVLLQARNMMLGMASQDSRMIGIRPNGLSDVPQYKLDIDQEKASAFGLSISDITATIGTAWGSTYVNDFVDNGRIKRVYMQGDAPYRMLPEDVQRWYVRNNKDKMVPFSSFVTGSWEYGPSRLERYNGRSSMEILGAPAQGVSSGVAMAAIEDMAKKLPEGISLEWTGLSYEERLAGSQTTLLYAVSLLIVFLCLAALYESWTIPFAVMLIVPLGIIGTVAATRFTGLSNDVYFQIALLTTVGLVAKNAILIVEFAKDLVESGRSIIVSTMLAAEQRLRPILMTSMAFILGVTPLAIANGAGSASQNAIGIGVIGGMIAATTLAMVFVPMFFIVIEKWSLKRKKVKPVIKSEVNDAL